MKPAGLEFFGRRALGLAALASMAFLAGCEQDGRLSNNSRHYVPISAQMEALMAEKGMNSRQPVLLRAYKKESELEVWKMTASGEYKLLKTFPMCRWSGQLGPKKAEGDRQVPEGFYAITPAQLNPNSSFYLSFNVGYPNTYDKQFGRTGSHIMVHGACSSRGCFSMTDEQIAEIYALTREAFGGGQKAVQLQSLPFRMTPDNLAKYRADENMPFWKNLKEGADHFEVTKREPQVSVCNRRYVFDTASADGAACSTTPADEAVASAVRQKNAQDEQRVASLVQGGVKAVKRVYQDGDQHHSFKHTIYAAGISTTPGSTATPVPQGVSRVAEVSQPDALDQGAVDVPHDVAKGLDRKTLIKRAAELKAKELNPTPAPVAAPKTNAVANAPAPKDLPKTTATALVATDAPKKDEPAFYRRWLGSLGGLSANSEGTSEVAPQAVEAPLPPKAPRR
ncbi:MAG TPA: L,D-transpeptidase family protein [Rhabdaerophilum sp.]|nr:L,D-transpeptidase family protein [Rhabdaerophilum sp.]